MLFHQVEQREAIVGSKQKYLGGLKEDRNYFYKLNLYRILPLLE